MVIPSRPRRSSGARLAALAVAALLGLGACGATTESPTPEPTATPAPSVVPTSPPPPTPTPDPDAIYDEIEAQVVAIRGLEPTGDVARIVLDEAELGRMVAEMFAEENPPEYVAATDRFYTALGLMPADEDLEDLVVELLSGSVAGFYRNDIGTLHLVSKTGAPGATERITFAHEYTHALQDQHFTVFADQDGVRDQGDRILARQAVYEGDATLLMSLWAGIHFTLQDLTEILQLANDPAQAALLGRMPAILRETLLFPYTTGHAFILRIHAEGGWDAVNDVYGRMPVSTTQILHPEKYLAAVEPLEVALPVELASRMGDGWSVPLEDTFGEFQLRIWLQEGGVPVADATAAAAGWAGDRVAVLVGPDGAWGVVVRTAWESAADAAEFADAAQVVVNGLSDPTRISAPSGTRVTVMVGSDDETLLRLDRLFGATGV